MTRSRLSPRLAATGVLCAVLAGCSGSSAGPSTTPSSSAPPTATATTSSTPTPSVAGKVAWLCRPGLAHSPCDATFDTTVITTSGATHVTTSRAARHPAVDCFYVYPTVSQAAGLNAPLKSTPAIIATVRAQAALFSTKCRLFVPLYRQVTVTALGSGGFFDPDANAEAQADVVAAWRSYLAHDNHGRGVVLIGHSQGAMRLTKLIRQEIDPSAQERRLLVAAILLGGNVTVPAGKSVGGDFAHIATCRSARQTGCLVAYSSFATTPPTLSFFGRAGPDQQVVCVAPTQLLRRTHLTPIVPTRRLAGAVLSGGLPGTASITTDYIAYPGRLTGKCVAATGAHVLHVSGDVDGKPVADLQTLGPQWGLHIADVNIDLGDLLTLVGLEASAYSRRH